MSVYVLTLTRKYVHNYALEIFTLLVDRSTLFCLEKDDVGISGMAGSSSKALSTLDTGPIIIISRTVNTASHT